MIHILRFVAWTGLNILLTWKGLEIFGLWFLVPLWLSWSLWAATIYAYTKEVENGHRDHRASD